jgi:uncharacterized membrane protein YfcA
MSLLLVSGYTAAIFMGMAVGLVGAGGSVLTVPILVFFFGLDGLTATADSLFVVGTIALIGAVMNARRGNVNFKTGLIFALPSFMGVFVARKVVLPLIPETMLLPGGWGLSKSLLVLMSFAVLMIFASRAMIVSGRKKTAVPEFEKTHSHLSVSVKGFIVGCITGFVGAGGGFLIIPSLVLLLRMPMRMAVGTSLAIIAANSLFGFSLSFANHTTNWSVLLAVTTLGIAGLLVGHYLSPRFPEHGLKKGFGYMVLLVGVFIIANQVF